MAYTVEVVSEFLSFLKGWAKKSRYFNRAKK